MIDKRTRQDKLARLGQFYMGDDNLYIDVIVPYEPGGRLGYAYNRAMQTVEDWVLFLDQDLLLLNPMWYMMCLQAIRQYGNDCGWFTCWTNRLARDEQRRDDAPQSNDIEEHREFSRKLWTEYGNQVTDITIMPPPNAASGFFMLTNKVVWQTVGGFKEGFLSVDNDYHYKMLRHKYKVLRMDGLYIYHHYSRDWFWETSHEHKSDVV